MAPAPLALEDSAMAVQQSVRPAERHKCISRDNHWRLVWLFFFGLFSTVVGVDAILHGSSVGGQRTYVCISSFSTPQELQALPWVAISDAVQSLSRLTVGANGDVLPEVPSTWPLESLRTAAHQHGARLWVGVHVDSGLFTAGAPTIASAAASLAATVADASYDGFQLDVEGLHPESKAAYESFVAACARSAEEKGVGAQVTMYAPKLLEPLDQPEAYNISFLAATMPVFIMGYDMHWLNLPAGQGWQEAGPNSPLDALTAALDRAASVGAPADSLILGLPLYGRVFVCDGDAAPAAGSRSNCSCAEKNFKKKSLDQMEPIAEQRASCFGGYDAATATPWWECPHGSGIPGIGNATARQQGWYENAKSLQTKLNLASSRGLLGAGAWAAHGIGNGSAFDETIWNLFEAFRHN
jgi:hypothetical protein